MPKIDEPGTPIRQAFVFIPLTRNHSLLKLLTGFANAAFIAWKLTVSKVIPMAPAQVTANIHHDISVR